MSIELVTIGVTTEFRYQRKDYEYLVTLGVALGEMRDPGKTKLLQLDLKLQQAFSQ